MKRSIAILSLLLLALVAGAQEGKDIYNRYSGRKGVSAVYISPTMFSMIRTIPDIQVRTEEVNLGNIIKTFDGMYILDVENPDLASELSAELEKMVGQGRYELLMEAVEEGETMHIYIVRDGDTVTDFIMLVHEPGSASVISITGSMPMEELSKIVASASES